MINTKSPLVSINVVTYNHEKYIEQCLDSILNQKTDFKFEIILGEDDSTDNTRAICKEYAHQYPNKIRLFLRSRKDVIYINGNPTGRFNFMENLKAAKGKYIALCEGDDYWTDPLKLQKQVDFLESHSSYSGSFHDTLTINQSEEKPIFKPWRVYDKNIFNLEDTISSVALFHTSSFVFRKSFLEIPEWFTKVQSADMALFSIISNKGPLYRIDESMSVYRKNEGGITNTITLKSYHSNRIKLFKYLKSYCKRSVIDNINQVILFHSREIKKLAKPTLANRWKRRLIKLLK
jgi:glycosyltransferase involved in cell wall biosynthesis